MRTLPNPSQKKRFHTEIILHNFGLALFSLLERCQIKMFCPTSGFFSGVANSFVSNIHRLKCEEKFVSLVKKKDFWQKSLEFWQFFPIVLRVETFVGIPEY